MFFFRRFALRARLDAIQSFFALNAGCVANCPILLSGAATVLKNQIGGESFVQVAAESLFCVPRAYVFDPASPARFLGLEAVDALSSFALIQWYRLDWEIPDAIIPMPDADSISIGRSFAISLDAPFMRALHLDCEIKENLLEEELTLLLFDVSNRMEKLLKASLALSEAFPKRIYLLSLIPYVDPFS